MPKRTTRDTRNAPPRSAKEQMRAIPSRAEEAARIDRDTARLTAQTLNGPPIANVPAPPVEASKPPRTYKVWWSDDRFALVLITNGGGAEYYLIERLVPNGFMIRKLAIEGAWRTVTLAPASCPCKGFINRGTCKHVEVLLALRAKGVV